MGLVWKNICARGLDSISQMNLAKEYRRDGLESAKNREIHVLKLRNKRKLSLLGGPESVDFCLDSLA